ncbi:hypothetical protein B0H16DRAFT_1889982 [Mycena metata]|uniref:Uncharacterized protein n=1 Tax=Mycena metata TaxID=1033252 RepID=A0AAD7IK57_9AGAR|nr:hypothetical protein B0H16DRAFT_1889982 [Mycena metata]
MTESIHSVDDRILHRRHSQQPSLPNARKVHLRHLVSALLTFKEYCRARAGCRPFEPQCRRYPCGPPASSFVRRHPNPVPTTAPSGWRMRLMRWAVDAETNDAEVSMCAGRLPFESQRNEGRTDCAACANVVGGAGVLSRRDAFGIASMRSRAWLHCEEDMQGAIEIARAENCQRGLGLEKRVRAHLSICFALQLVLILLPPPFCAIVPAVEAMCTAH